MATHDQLISELEDLDAGLDRVLQERDALGQRVQLTAGSGPGRLEFRPGVAGDT